MKKLAIILSMALMGCGDDDLMQSPLSYKGYTIVQADKETGVMILEHDKKMTYIMAPEYYMTKYKLGDTIK